MFKMKILLFLCFILAVNHYAFARPNTDMDDVYDTEDLLNDEENGYPGEDGEEEDFGDDEDDKEDLSLNFYPVFKSQALTLTAIEGDNVTFPCDTENADAFSILWKQNEKMIYQDKIQVGDGNKRYKRFENQSLVIESVTANDEGIYECSISTSPVMTVLRHTLIVHTPPRIVNVTANNMQDKVAILRGGILELACNAEGNPLPKVSWSKDGGRVSENNKKFNSAIVTITDVSRDDGGIYVCMADNKILKPVLKSIEVSVTHAPDVKVEKIIVGDNELDLICKVHAHPKAEIFWTRNNKKLKHSTDAIKLEQKHHDNEHIVKFKHLQKSDFGNYTCKATNNIGVTEKHITVSGVPFTPKYEKQMFVDENNYVKMTWIVASMKPITALELQYRRKGKANTWITEHPTYEPTPGHTHHIEYTLKNLESGVYEVRLRSQNEFGWSDYSRHISIEGKSVDISSSITKIEEPPMPVDEKYSETNDISSSISNIEEPTKIVNENNLEPVTDSASRTILSWTSILSLALMTMYSKLLI